MPSNSNTTDNCRHLKCIPQDKTCGFNLRPLNFLEIFIFLQLSRFGSMQFKLSIMIVVCTESSNLTYFHVGVILSLFVLIVSVCSGAKILGRV